MRSLRTRVILGTAIIALLPLAVTSFVLSKRLENLVRTQADTRLTSALDNVVLRWQSDEEATENKLRLLVRDPDLRRLYLVRGGSARDLSDYVAENRKLLDLDILQVTDTTGNEVIAESLTDSLPPVVSYREEPIYYEREPVGRLRGGFFVDKGFLLEQKAMTGVDYVLMVHGGGIVASTLEDPAQPSLTEGNGGPSRVSTDSESFLVRSEQLGSGFAPTVVAYVSTAASEKAIRTFQLAAAMLALFGLVLAILLGTLWSSQISRPVEELADFSRKVAEGEWEEPLKLHSVKELETLVTALDRMRQDLKTYRERLVVTERHAAWSQMARKVAHEVKNPLTPIAVSIADLKRSYEQQRPDFPKILDQAVKTIGEEVDRLKHMLQEFSEFGRLPAPQFTSCRLTDLFADLGALYTKDVQAKRVFLEAPDPNITLTADPSQLRQAMVNLLQNGLEAVNGNGQVKVTATPNQHDIEISISDNGPGLTPEQTQRLFSPGFTTKQTGSGLGLVMVEKIVSDHRGSINVQSQPGKGTTFTLRLPRNTET